MNDQYRQDPEENLPDWLKELRNRGSIEGDSAQADSESEGPEEIADQEDDFSGEPPVEAPSDQEETPNDQEEAANANEEPDWLQEIRHRHQQDTESEIVVASDVESPIESDPQESSIEDQEEAVDEHSQGEALEEDAPITHPSPILEVPVEPPLSEASALSADEEADDIEEGLLSIDSFDTSRNKSVTESFKDAFKSAFPDYKASDDDSSEDQAEEDADPESSEASEEAPQITDLNEEKEVQEEDEADEKLNEAEDKGSMEASKTVDAFSEEEPGFIDEIDSGLALEKFLADDIELEAQSATNTNESEQNASPEPSAGTKDDAQEESLDWLNNEQIASDEEEHISATNESEQNASPEPSTDTKDDAQEESLDWLNNEQIASDEEEPISAFSDVEKEEISPAKLPAWLAKLKPVTEPTNINAADEDADEYDFDDDDEYSEDQERVGPLAGLSGIIPAEPEVIQMGRSKIPTGDLTQTESQQMHVANLEQLLAKEGVPIEDKINRIALPMRVMQLIFASLIILATLFPLINGSQIAARPQIGSLPETTAFYNQIELLPPDIPVLIAFEVQPALYGEMKTLSATVLNHLLDRQARLVFISTQPTGPALVERLLAEELSSQPSIATGDYVNLGYLSGGTAALRFFASNPRAATLLPQQWQSNILESIENISNFGLVITITGNAEDARAWIEQVSPFTSDGLFSISSAQAAPLLLPYLESDPVTVRSIVAGLKGAAYYESLRNHDGLGRKYWDAYSYGLGAIVILILLGSLYGRLLQLRPEPTKANPDAN